MSHTPAQPDNTLATLVSQIADVIQQARGHVRQSVNQAMVASYWEIGRLIVEHELQGQARAAYGQRQLAALSERLTAQFGRGFDERNLRNMRLFFPELPDSERSAYRIELDVHLPSGAELKRELERERERAVQRLTQQQETEE